MKYYEGNSADYSLSDAVSVAISSDVYVLAQYGLTSSSTCLLFKFNAGNGEEGSQGISIIGDKVE